MGEAKRRGSREQRVSSTQQQQSGSSKEFDRVSEFLGKGLKLEADVLERGKKIREEAKKNYRSEWLDARLTLLSIAQHIFLAKNLIPGKTSEDVSHILILLTAFYQGTHATENMISEGQYIKAAAALKQDYEIVARICEVRACTAKSGQTPQVRHFAKEVRGYYGELNKVAHPSNQEMLENLMSTLSLGESQAISHIPVYNEQYSQGLYELHIWFIFMIVQQHLRLFVEMYGKDEPAIRDVANWFLGSVSLLKAAGFKFDLEKEAS